MSRCMLGLLYLPKSVLSTKTLRDLATSEAVGGHQEMDSDISGAKGCSPSDNDDLLSDSDGMRLDARTARKEFGILC